MAAGSVAAQEVEPRADSIDLSDRVTVTVSLGARIEFRSVASPGVTGQLTVTPRPGRVWFSMSFLAQMRRWTARRDQIFLRRFALGVGTDEGPSAFVFVEGGTGRIETKPDYLTGRTYGLFGIGLGAAYTVGRLTATADLGHGEIQRRECPPLSCYPADLYTIWGASLRWRLF